MNPTVKNFFRDESATTAVEFSLISMAFLTLIFGIFEIGRLLLTQNSFQYSVENATRYALVTEDVTSDDLADYISDNARVLTLDPDKMVIDIAFEDASDINFVKISGTYDFSPMIMTFLPDNWANITLTASSRMPVLECSAESCPWD